jgi:hypothetical protein
VCSGCGSFDSVSTADVNTDGKADLVVRDGSTIYVYPNTAAPGAVAWGPRQVICSGCAAFDAVNVADVNSDGKVDLAVRENGTIYVYPNTAAPGGIAWGARLTVCAGCAAFDAVLFGDLDNTGTTDLVMRETGTIWLYPNTAAPGGIAWGTRSVACSGCGTWRDIN